MDKEMKARLAKALGLALDASDEVLVVHAETQSGVAHGAPDPKLYVPMAAFTELQTTVSQLQHSTSVAHAASLVDAASKAGKLTPALRGWALAYASKDPAEFEVWVAAAPVIVPGGVDPALADAATAEAARIAAQGAVLTKDELAVCTQLGLDPKAYSATKQEAA